MPHTAATAAPPAAFARPELLAPAGDWDCVRAAVENGADAIYFGLERFNARMRAQNFTAATLPKVMEFLHARGVKGYITFNILVFANELAEAEEFLRAIIAAGADGVLVQDAGVCRLIRQLSPDFPIHASTQMSVTSLAGVDFARQLGCTRIVLARECSAAQAGQIHHGQQARLQAGGAGPELELETFVHGALCVAYSGQCLTSEAMGGRSANRGECAQACRMPYAMESDGAPVPLGDRRYLLSPLDLAGMEVLPELMQAGVAAVKIEGRLKSAEYVANITRLYREAIDQIWAALQSQPGSAAPLARSLAARAKYAMEMAFSRGLYPGWLRGINHQELVQGRFGKKRGAFLGRVTRVQGERVYVELEGALKPGDGIVFDAGRPEEPEQGGRVYGVEPSGRGAWLAFGHGDVNFQKTAVGDRLWKTSDPELERQLRKTYEGDQLRFQRPVDARVGGALGQPMTLTLRDEAGHEAAAASTLLLAAAAKQPLDEPRLREQLGRLGGTPFRLGRLDNQLAPGLILPVSELNRLRREAVSQLETLRAHPVPWRLNDSPAELQTRRSGPAPETLPEPQLVVLVRTWPQFQAALESGVETLYCEFEDPRRYREAVAAFRTAWNNRPGAAIFAAPPRITKPGEQWMLEQVRASEADGWLVRNHDHLTFFTGRRIGDFSLNIANGLSAEHFIQRYGLERVTASYDLNFEQLQALLQSAPPEWFEITLHQHIPMFHMDYCVFCAFLSKGTDASNCGRPCEKHQVVLRDHAGAAHPVKADAGCRNTVFNSLAQTGAEYAQRMIALGARRFRVEFLDDPPERVTTTLARYGQLLRGEITGAQLWRELRLLNQLGVTRGQMEARR